MDVRAIPGDENDKLTCPRCGGKVFEAERMVTKIGSYHKACFSCIECAKKLDSTDVCEGKSQLRKVLKEKTSSNRT